jgi:hypothetical protein
MSSKSGETTDQSVPERSLLSPTSDDSQGLDEVSDVESFSRTRPDVEDDDGELDIPEPSTPRRPARAADTNGSPQTPQTVVEAAEDDGSTVKTHDGAAQEPAVSIHVWIYISHRNQVY